MTVPRIFRRAKRSHDRRRRFVWIMRMFRPGARRSRRRRVSPRLTAPVKVWDAKLGAFRSVDLYNLDDPLWEVAKELAVQSKLAG